MRLRGKFKSLSIDGSQIEIRRDRNGVVHLRGADDLDFARALGFAHGCDRMLQMMLLRVVARGQICERLRDDDTSLAIDLYMRRKGFSVAAEADAACLSPGGLRFAEAYTAGINCYLQQYGHPWEFSLVGYRPDPWTVADCLLTVAIMSHVGMAQAQEDLERFIIQSLHNGIDPTTLKALFSPHLDGLTDEIVKLVQKVRLFHTLVPQNPAFSWVPSMVGSNSWVLAPHRTDSGHVFQCNDPHLEYNRLPAVWYEFVMEMDGGFRMGASLPGVPGLVMGRTECLSRGFTYGFMDMVDFFIEECRDGMYRRGEDFLAFSERREIIHRKRHASVAMTSYENDLGTLEIDPEQKGLTDGHYLLTAWSAHPGGTARTIDALWDVLQAQTVSQAQSILRNVTISCNWIIGDSQGNIGYQQSGVLPDRRHSGLYPLPAWIAENRWKGMVPAEQLASTLNPDEGFLVSANGDHNQPGKPQAINMPMSPYREERISALLRSKERHSLGSMKEIQTDFYSPQAERFISHFRDLIPDSRTGAVLRDWDLRYDKESRGAVVFEAVYLELLRKLVGETTFGEAVWDHVVNQTSILVLYGTVFDRALLDAASPWHLAKVKRDVLAEILRGVLNRLEVDGVPEWGQVQRARMENIFFAGRLPRLFGFDHGPVPIEGGRATIYQGGAFRSHGRFATFGPSYRYVADLGQAEIHTSLAGGPSDRRFSPWYKSDLSTWLSHDYKVIKSARPQASTS